MSMQYFSFSPGIVQQYQRDKKVCVWYASNWLIEVIRQTPFGMGRGRGGRVEEGLI